jgi:hypothetical protein
MKSSESPKKENDCDEDGRGGGIEDEHHLVLESRTIGCAAEEVIGEIIQDPVHS